jgi:hypothetical protein
MHTLPLLLAALLAAAAPSQAPSSTPARQDCTAPEHRQFDFWLGDWDVVAGGKPAGRNRISADLGGCVLVEQWTSARGNRGTSLNFHDRSTRTWRQVWMDDQGNALLLEGTFRDGEMVLESTRGAIRQRITWRANPDGTVRQLWEQSRDGAAWTTAFDGLYTRRR